MSNAALRLAKHQPAVEPCAPFVEAVELSLPSHRYDQQELIGVLQARWRDRPQVVARIASLHEAVEVRSRCLALPIEAYAHLDSFDEANDAFIRVGTELGARAIDRALERAKLHPEDVDAIVFTTVTGVAAPTIDARIMNRLRLRRDVRRLPLFGLGCVGGAAGLARVTDYLRGHPDHVALLLSVELCSLTLQDDLSIPNLIASGLFGDGAACAVLVGSERRAAIRGVRGAPRIVDSRSAFFRDSERVMGWDIGARGFKIVLSADVPRIVHEQLPSEVDAFLAEHDLVRDDVRRWICHPGGPKVIAAIEQALDLDRDALALTRRSLAEVGNLSSASVLDVLHRTLPCAREGEVGVLLAMGPGFCAELVLMSW
ncbi:MAG: type III polyketide synthase [Labilithrix sp.]|nr:type III polyketide synthase [Labilithrix sp.]